MNCTNDFYLKAQIKLSDQHGFFVSPRAGAQFNLTTYLAIDVGFAYNLALNGSENVDAVLLLDENQVNFVPGTNAEATNTYSINLGVVFTILEND